ncbi:hypothetical protein ACFFSH_28955 [Streptomyces filamentosus]|uniref:Uncharacterized protein n=1 Tax=Streptomyces filamentosus TaxID=67294 RepID=A0A919BXQ5_STRFL|nr:hypothetical protein [Streptomyces filamentosus]GHG22688.1 hypothetical protein GCM10017667_68310 [Streptomyces filamentosus]
MTRSHPPHPLRKQAEPTITVVSVPAPARRTEKEQIFHDGLTEHLLFALPIAMLEISRMPPHALDPLRATAAAAIGGRGDVLQFPSKKHTAEAGQQLDLGLAYLALITAGGITKFGVHACAAPHDDCPADTSSSNQTESTT